ncbi:MAG: hypothetical protein NC299_05150 [Lachnospiraceae bacterium]|nr:hypothetical protein [Ruminococcus sp.]MCM1274738.1 hypothetical protein [Lachnospiraceae bacterium]
MEDDIIKKVITAICIAALLASLAGCSGETASDGSSSVPESSGGTESTTESTSSSESAPESTESAPESSEPEEEYKEPTLEELIAGFTLDEIPLPDGIVLKKTEAVEGMGSADYSILKFDVGVLSYSLPVFQSSYGDPDSFDWDNYVFLEPVETQGEHKSVTVRAGDTLENGMTVKSAYTYFEAQGEPYYKDSVIQLEGEMTVEGILYCREEDDYGVYAGDLELYIDTSKTENVPMKYEQYGRTTWTYTFPEHKMAITIDGTFYDFGNIGDCGVDMDEVFLESPFAKVRATFKDPLLRITESTARRITAELVDIEVIG